MKAGYFSYFIFLSGYLFSQKTEVIKIKKSHECIYFFQKGIKSDSILNHSFFYLLVPDSLKKDISIYSANGQLVRTNNDSILQFNYLPGLSYELLYTRGEAMKGFIKRPSMELKTLVNGTVDTKLGEIYIRIVNKPDDRILIENTFYLKN